MNDKKSAIVCLIRDMTTHDKYLKGFITSLVQNL